MNDPVDNNVFGEIVIKIVTLRLQWNELYDECLVHQPVSDVFNLLEL